MGHIYIIEDDSGRVKIGRSINPESRIKNISTGAGIRINKSYVSEDLSNYSNIENILLKKFRDESSIGEWVSAGYCEVVEFAKSLILDIGSDDYKKGTDVDNGDDDELIKQIKVMAYQAYKEVFDLACVNERANFLLTMDDFLIDAINDDIDWKEAFMGVYKIVSKMAWSMGKKELNDAILNINSISK